MIEVAIGIVMIGAIFGVAVLLWLIYMVRSDRNNNGVLLGKKFAIVDIGVRNNDKHSMYVGYNDTLFYRTFGIKRCCEVTSVWATIYECKDDIQKQYEENEKVNVRFEIDEYVVR